VEILAAFREGRTYLPQSDFVLREGDQMLVVVSPTARERLSKHFAPILS
jgi:Trk K+ transport system NAD-binding subunit